MTIIYRCPGLGCYKSPLFLADHVTKRNGGSGDENKSHGLVHLNGAQKVIDLSPVGRPSNLLFQVACFTEWPTTFSYNCILAGLACFIVFFHLECGCKFVYWLEWHSIFAGVQMACQWSKRWSMPLQMRPWRNHLLGLNAWNVTMMMNSPMIL